MKTKLRNLFIYLFFAFCLWIATTGIIQAFINPEMTQTELFLNIPNSATLNFKR